MPGIYHSIKKQETNARSSYKQVYFHVALLSTTPNPDLSAWFVNPRHVCKRLPRRGSLAALFCRLCINQMLSRVLPRQFYFTEATWWSIETQLSCWDRSRSYRKSMKLGASIRSRTTNLYGSPTFFFGFYRSVLKSPSSLRDKPDLIKLGTIVVEEGQSAQLWRRPVSTKDGFLGSLLHCSSPFMM